MAGLTAISVAVEGVVDEAVVRRLIARAGGTAGPVYGRQGKSWLRQKTSGLNNAARHAPWFVLVDLDGDNDCAPPLRRAWLPQPAAQICFRVAVRAVEAWLLADAEALAKFLRVSPRKVPADPEAVPNPKEAMVNLARSSRRRAIREDMVPRPGSGRNVGPAYASRMIEFATTSWRPEKAAERADSLDRALRCLDRLIGARR